MWFLNFAGNAMDVEETMYGLISGKGKPVKAMVVSMVTKELVALEASFKAAPADTWKFEFTKEDTANRMAKAKKSLDIVVNIAKTLNRTSSDLLLTYCRDTLLSSKLDENRR